ncbi:E3 ubiquitin-protein ligase KCMF1 [Drosophila rhopaloa]|uniref:RING-type E3 ubiquitin transferase n=1 Tax=Drosophila rhopaloa TaxID=1041015 RepID=A0A6P4ESW3_DRORH|nr:E3 ubiquitin-protein ligase KCMF1 [Drosophila rhopaloa]
MSLHWNVNCDGCGTTRLIHYRYKCLRCPDYDLCSACHEGGVATGAHERGHPFQCLLDRAARELHFAGESIPDLCADSFTCPLCGQLGLSAGELIRHCQARHRAARTSVICPLCVAVPSSHPGRVSNLAGHLGLLHPASILRAPEAPPLAVGSPASGLFQWSTGGGGGTFSFGGAGRGAGRGVAAGAGAGAGAVHQQMPSRGLFSPATFATHRSLPSVQMPQVRFVLPTGTPPLAAPEDLSDNDIVEM